MPPLDVARRLREGDTLLEFEIPFTFRLAARSKHGCNAAAVQDIRAEFAVHDSVSLVTSDCSRGLLLPQLTVENRGGKQATHEECSTYGHRHRGLVRKREQKPAQHQSQGHSEVRETPPLCQRNNHAAQPFDDEE